MNALFLIHSHYALTLKRFLLLIDPLHKRGAASVFLDLSSNLEEVLRSHARDLNIQSDFRTIPWNSLSTQNEIPVWPDSKNNQPDFTSEPIDSTLSRLLAKYAIDPLPWIAGNIKPFLQTFETQAAAAFKFLEDLEPACVIYDLETPQKVRATLWAAKQLNIPVLSIQHGEGNAEQYDQFPVLADDYIAYTPYNAVKLRELGVPEKSIHLTGFPEMDLIPSFDAESIKKAFEEKYSLKFDQPVLLTALKPNNNPAFQTLNQTLLEELREAHEDHPEIHFVVKTHPVDSMLPAGEEMIRRIKETYPRFIWIESDETLYRCLAVCDALLTFYSGSLVEALLMDVPAGVIPAEDGVRWPPWDSFRVFETVDFNAIGAFIDSGWEAPSARKPEAWMNFLDYFRFPRDGRACERIADVILALSHDIDFHIHQTTGIMNQ